MSLVEAMNALERGEIERPPEGALGALMDPFAELPVRPAPPPARHAETDIVAEWQAEKRAIAAEMLACIQRKRAAVNASAVYSRDALANTQDAARRHQITKRLDEAEQQLTENGND
jgi:hypothetical protein